MKNGRKILSIILALTMIMQILPVFATEGAEETGGAANNINYIINDTFDSDLGGWTTGASTYDYTANADTLTLDNTTFDGLGVMKFVSTGPGDGTGKQPNIIRTLDEAYTFNENKVVVKTRFYHTGDGNGNGIANLKFNRPNVNSISFTVNNTNVNDLGMQMYSMFRTAADNFGYGYGSNVLKSLTSAETLDVYNKWIEAEMVFDGTADEDPEDYTLTVKIGDTTYPSVAATTEQCYAGAYTEAGYTDKFDSIKNFTWLLRAYAGTLYVDYFQVYEVTEINADVEIQGGRTVEAGAAVQLKFINVYNAADGTTAATVTSVPEGAIKVNDSVAAYTFDEATQTISVKPASGEFAEGETYVITLDEGVLSAAGIICTGTTEFTVTGRGARSKGLVINDTFDDGSLGGWIVGQAADGYTAGALEIVDVEGEEGNKALKFTTTATPATVSSGDAKTPNITTAVGNGIEYEEGKKIIIKTRVMNTNIDSSLVLKHNRPNVKVQTQHEIGWNLYGLFRQSNAAYNDDGTYKCQPVTYAKGIVATTQGNMATMTGSSSVYGPKTVDKWVEYVMEIDGAVNAMKITATYASDDGTGDKTYTRSDGNLLLPTAVYEMEYGEGTTRTVFDALDRLTFIFMNNASTAYIDYIQVYEEDAFATAAMSADTYKSGEDIKVAFDTEMDLTAIPEGAVTIDGVETAQSFDAATKELTLTPAAPLTLGTVYTVTLDAEKLEEEGMFYTGETELTFKYTGEYTIYDTFDNDLGSWVEGAIKTDTDDEYVERVTLDDDTTAMLIAKVNGTFGTSNNQCIAEGSGNQPNAINELATPIEFSADKKVVIKTRIMHTGDGYTTLQNESVNTTATTPAGIAYLKINRPNTTTGFSSSYAGSNGTTTSTNELGHNWYTAFRADNASFKQMKTAGNTPVEMVTGSTLGKWIDVELTFNGTEAYTISATIDGTTTTATGTIAQTNNYQTGAYENYTDYYLGEDAETVTAFSQFDSFTFMLRAYENKLYVDYFTVQELPLVDADTLLLCGDTIEAGAAAQLQFINVYKSSDGTTAATVTSVPEGAIKVNGSAAVQTFDEATQTVSFKPASGEFAEGTVYTITLDEGVLSEAGITCTGTKEFTSTGRGPRSTALVINDNFADGVDGWYAGPSAEGYEATLAQVSATSTDANYDANADGASNGKALKIEFPARSTSSLLSSAYGNVTKAVGNGIEFTDDKAVIVKARIKKTSADGEYQIRVNRPDTLAQTLNDFEWINYAVIRDYPHNSSAANQGIGVLTGYAADLAGFEWGWPSNTAINATKAVDFENKWVTYTLRFEPSADTYYTTISYTDENGEEVTVVEDNNAGLMWAAKASLEQEFGEGYFNYDKTASVKNYQYYDALERLTFTAITDNDVYIDYVQVYEEDSIVDVKVKDTIRYDEAFKVEFDTTMELADVNDIVSVEGLEDAVQSFDTETKTLTITPAQELTAGDTYTLNVDAEALAELGFLYEESGSYTVRIRDEVIIDDDFNTDLGDWVEGDRAAVDGQTVTVEQTTYDGSGVMHLGATLPCTVGKHMPTVANDFAEIDFSSDRVLVLETRFLATEGEDTYGADGVQSLLMFNRPNDLDVLAASSSNFNWYGWHGGTLISTGKWYGRSGETIDATYKGTAYKSGSYNVTVHDEHEAGQWVNARIVINPSSGTYGEYKITTWADNDEANAATATGTLREFKPAMYDIETFLKDETTPHSKHYSMRNLTFGLRAFSGDLYIDHIKLYEQENYSFYGVIPGGATVKAGEAAEMLVVSEKPVLSIPAGAIKVNGSAAVQTFDEAAQTVSFKPASGEFVEGQTYAVTIDTALLEEYMCTYTGTTAFTITGRGDRVTGNVVEDDFAEDTDGWIVGESADGYEATLAQVSSTSTDANYDANADGATDGKAIKIDFPARGTSGDSQYGSVTKSLGNGIEFNDGENVVIEARVKKTSADGYYDLKLNRPNTEAQLKNDVAWLTNYSLAINEMDEGGSYDGIRISQGVYPDMSSGGTYYCPKLAVLPNSADVSFATKWVTYKFVLNYESKKIYTTVTYTDGDNEVVLAQDDESGCMMATKWALENEHGEGCYDIMEQYYEALERITFTSINDCDIYVDYVNVYTTANIDESISAKLMTGEDEVVNLTENTTVVPTFALQPKDGAETTYYTISAKYINGLLDTFTMTPVTTTGGTYTHTGYALGDSISGVEIKAFVWDTKLVPLCSAATAAPEMFTVYVRAGGDDGATGESTSPVASLERALEIVYTAVEDEGLEEAEIAVGDGNYKVDSTITIAKADSVPANGLKIRNIENEEPVFVGGNTYTGDMAVKVTNEAVLAKVPSSAHNNLYQIELGVDVPGISYPGVPSYSIKNAVMGLGLESDITSVTSDVAFDGQLMTIARWPDEGYETTTKVYDPVAEAWLTSTAKADYANIYTAKTDFADLDEDDVAAAESDDLKTKAQTGVSFGVDTSKDISAWANAADALIFGYWMHDWATQTMPLDKDSVDTTNNAVTTKYASWYGARTGARYYVFNLLEELDTQNEYYIDRSPDGNDILYFYSETAPTEENKITISLLDESSPMLKVSTVNKDVVIDGLTFENSRGVGVSLSGATGATVQNCEMRNLGSHAISAYSRYCTVQNNYIHDTNGGIIVNHDDQQYVEPLEESGNYVYNNEIKNYARLDKVYVDGIQLSGVKNIVSHNKIHDSSHLAVRISGINNEFKYNEITNVLQEVDDAGAVYMGRTWNSRGNKITSNYIHDISSNVTGGSPVSGVYMDDHYAGIEVSGNVFKNIGGHGVMTNRGRELVVTNNLCINCTKTGISIGGPDYDDGKTVSDFTTQKAKLDEISSYFNNDEWKAAFPELCVYGLSSATDWGAQQRIIVKDNVTIGCGNGVKVSAYAATYVNEEDYDGAIDASYLSSDVSNNAGTVTAAVLGSSADDTAATPYYAASLSADDYAEVVANPALAVDDFGVTGFKAIDFASMRK